MGVINKFTEKVDLLPLLKYLRLLEILVIFDTCVRILEIIVQNVTFSKNVEYYYLQNALRILEIIVPTGAFTARSIEKYRRRLFSPIFF